ncbi:MAG: helix-turn-helix domain-containing protein, partial [Candidatus Latescibacteria bacterium]|nr:helix-turn-helix domain-containing protein [Candidatus Latescibacterota bacterium]
LIERLMVLSKTRQIAASDMASYLDTSPAPEPTHLPVHLGKTPAESDRDLLYWAILEVARDVKELKAYLMQNLQTPPSNPVPSLPVYQEQTPIEGTEIEYTDATPPAEKDVRPLAEIEREAIVKALRATNGHRKRAAELLGMAERTLYRKIDMYDL